MTQDDVLFGYRLQLFDLAARTTVSHACRVFGVHRSTYYRWRGMIERSGLEMLRPRERGLSDVLCGVGVTDRPVGAGKASHVQSEVDIQRGRVVSVGAA